MIQFEKDPEKLGKENKWQIQEEEAEKNRGSV